MLNVESKPLNKMANSIEAGVDSIEHGIGLTPELAEQIENKRIFYVPTLSAYLAMKPTTNHERTRLTKEHLTKDMEIAKQFHLKVVAGSDYVGCDRASRRELPGNCQPGQVHGQ